MDRFERQKIQEREEHIEKQREATMDELRRIEKEDEEHGVYILATKAKEECYYLKKRPAGDEVYYWCDLDDHPCSKEYNDEECEEYEDKIKEETK